MKRILLGQSILLLCAVSLFAQVPTAALIKIAKAEDARAYDSSLETLMRSPNPAIRMRAALAAGRIGNDAAVPLLNDLLEKDVSTEVRAMAAFALGEIESVNGANAILLTLVIETTPDNVRARAVEAAGKIAAAHLTNEISNPLSRAILDTLDAQNRRAAKQHRDTVIFALTAALRTGARNSKRARPDDTDFIIAEFIKNPDARIRADAANILARLRSKNATAALRSMLATDKDAVARASAARALAAAEDIAALEALLNAATEDVDSRVRVSAIRALGALKAGKAAEKLLTRGEQLLSDYRRSKLVRPNELSELLEISVVVGNLLAKSNNERAVNFLSQFMIADGGRWPEPSIALLRISELSWNAKAADSLEAANSADWHPTAAFMQAVGELPSQPNSSGSNGLMGYGIGLMINKMLAASTPADQKFSAMVLPEALRAFAKFKRPETDAVLRSALLVPDPMVRAAAAEILADQPAAKENVEALQRAFTKALLTDKHDNDAQMAILVGLYKLDKSESVGSLLVAMGATDYVLRKRAFDLLANKDLQKDFPGISTSLENARKSKKDQVLPYSPVFGTKLGQVLNTDADYRRALSRKNGTVKAVLTTEKGTFTIDFFPEEAPLTVDNFVKLARSGYFNGLEVHRVVPNFVMQDGDPRGDGNGGPGWSIRCELNTREYDRGAVGMALSGKDTGGSQWFVTHSPQPHLDGGYTVFGRVNESGMKVVDNIVRGDRIIIAKIIEGKIATRGTKSTR